MKLRHWIRIGIGIVMLFGLSIVVHQPNSDLSVQAAPAGWTGSHLSTANNTIPTTIVSVDEAGMWVTYTHDPDGRELYGGNFIQNVVTGDIWWAQHDFVVRWSDTEGMQTVPIADMGYPGEYFSAFGTDHEGNIWLGMYTGYFKDERPSGGVLMLALDGTVTDYSDKVEGLISIAADRMGNRWFFERDFTTHFDGETWITEPSLAPAYVASRFYPDTLSVIEHGGMNGWYAESPAHVWSFYSLVGPGASVYDGNQWTTYTVEDGLTSEYVYYVAFDHQGHKWFSTSNEVCELDDNGTLAKDDDTWTIHPFEGRKIVVDHEGKVWVVDRSDGYLGLRVWDGQTWTTYNTSNSGLLDNFIGSILVDDTGVIWFGTSGGVTRLIQNPVRIYFPIVSQTL